jgi:hypothetical protein
MKNKIYQMTYDLHTLKKYINLLREDLFFPEVWPFES